MRIAILTARGGSVRVPRKNIRQFHGQPMLLYPITTARQSGLFDAIVVTTDDGEIAELATDAGAQVHMRMKDDGHRGTQDVAREVLMQPAWLKADQACVIYPCTPMLVKSDLHRAFAVLKRAGSLYSMSVTADPLADAGMFYAGSATAWRVQAPLIDSHTVLVPMPASRAIDINTPEDWQRAERMYEEWRRVHV